MDSETARRVRGSRDPQISAACEAVMPLIQGHLEKIRADIAAWCLRRDLDAIPGADEVVSALCDAENLLVAETAMIHLGYQDYQLRRAGIVTDGGES